MRCHGDRRVTRSRLLVLCICARRHKRSMGLTLAEAELSRLDQERTRDRVTLERERSYAENIVTKIEDVL